MELKLVEGFKLIDGIEDFSIEFITNQNVFDTSLNRNVPIVSQMSAKRYLRIFIQGLIDDCTSKTKSDFMSNLLRKKDYWRKIQYEKISQLNSLIDSALESERLELELERNKYLSFFYFIHRIIEYAEIEFDQLYLKEINNNQIPEIVKSDGQVLKKSESKLSEKFYSFYHLMLVHDLHILSNFETDINDRFNKKEIEIYGMEHYGTGQQFYREYLIISDMWKKKSDIAKHLGRDYKNKIIKISGNDHRIIDKLSSYPN